MRENEIMKLTLTCGVPQLTNMFKPIESFPDSSVLKNPPTMQETQEIWVQSLGQEDPMQYIVATHSSIIAWEIPWIEEPGRL